MPPLRNTLLTLTALTGTSTALYLRHTSIRAVPVNDPIYASAAYKAQNPLGNPVTQDVIVRRMPLSSIRRELLAREGAIVEAVTAGVFGGLAYAFQRRYLERKYRSPETESDLWTADAILSSAFPLGTRITDHFEVVDRTADAVTLRCGGSPREQSVRAGDGLFKVWVHVDRGRVGEEVEVGLTSVFFQGLGRAAGEPMGGLVKWLHCVYGRLMVEDGARRVMM